MNKFQLYKNIRAALKYLDSKLLAAILDTNSGVNIADIEYHVPDHSCRSLFYILLHSMYNKMNDSKGDPQIADNIRSEFRQCCKLLYSRGLRIDIGTLSDWNAMSTGELIQASRKPITVQENEAFDENTQDLFNIKDYSAYFNIDFKLTPDTIKYPHYMEYMEYSPLQRFMLDELLAFGKMVYKSDGYADTCRSYDLEGIRSRIAQRRAKYKEDEVIKARAWIKKTDLILKNNFDYWYKNVYVHLLYSRAKGTAVASAKTKDEKEAKAKQAAEAKKALEHYYGKYVPPFRNVSRKEVMAILRLGFALFPPSRLKRYFPLDSLANKKPPTETMTTEERVSLMKDLHRDTNEYMAYKKLLMANNMLNIKPIDQIASLPLPTYCKYITEDDLAFAPINSADDNISADGKKIDDNTNYKPDLEDLSCLSPASDMMKPYTLRNSISLQWIRVLNPNMTHTILCGMAAKSTDYSDMILPEKLVETVNNMNFEL